eukprot:scaffold9371_cov66-Cyclotella_meneghiniana.AAC.4
MTRLILDWRLDRNNNGGDCQSSTEIAACWASGAACRGEISPKSIFHAKRISVGANQPLIVTPLMRPAASKWSSKTTPNVTNTLTNVSKRTGDLDIGADSASICSTITAEAAHKWTDDVRG